MDATPMFPLGSVLLPGTGIPLHVFEPRYRQMVVDILATDGPPEFGQVLITHGLESGGGDERADVGTIARMAEIRALEGGRYAFVAVGVRRIRIPEWLPDDPYPRARVEDWPDEPCEPPSTAALSDAAARVAAVRELAAQVAGQALPALQVDPGDDPTAVTFRLAAAAPIGDADRFRLLSAADPADRLEELARCLEDVEAMLQFRLS
jgi:Lon protease-like protein